MLLRKMICFFCLVLPISGLYAVNPDVLNVTPADYGAANKNWAVAEDDSGTIYAGNDQGLLEFDGLQWRLYTPPGASIVRSVVAISHNTIFTGGFEEFGRWDRDASGTLQYTSLVPLEPGNRFADSDFWRIHATNERVLFQSFHEIYIYDYHEARLLPEWSDKNIMFLMLAGNEFWVQEMGGKVYRVSSAGFEEIPGSDIFRNTTVQFVLPDVQPRAWILGTGDKGLWHYDGSRFEAWCPALSERFRHAELNRGMLTSRNTFLFGTLLDGIYETDRSGRILNHLSTDNRLINNSVTALVEDRHHRIWASLERGLTCLTFLDGIDFHTYDSWIPGSIYDACRWQGRLLLATTQGVVAIDEKLLSNGGAQPTDFKPLQGLSGQIWSFSRLDDRLFVCHNRGVSEIGRDFRVTLLSRMGGYRIKRFKLGDRQHTLYASYYKLREFDGKEMRAIDGLDESIFNIETDYMQNLWLKHPSKGVYRCRMDDKGERLVSCKAFGGGVGDGLPYKLRQFPVGGRVAFVGDDQFFRYNEYTDQFEADSTLNATFRGVEGIRRVVPLDDSTFWVLADDGVWLLDYDGSRHATLRPCAGIPVRNLIYGYEQVVQLDDSTSLFCGDNGFELVSSYRNLNSPALPERPTVEAFGSTNREGDSDWYPLEGSVQVPFGRNSVCFYYRSSSGVIRGMQFRYRLIGIDDAWSKPDRTGKADYARLPQGHYTFEVAVSDSFGRWSEPAEFEFEVLAPWYQTPWAYICYFLLIMGLCYGGWILVMSVYRRRYLRHIRLEEIISLRRSNRKLQDQLEQSAAEVMTQSSMLLVRDEMVLHMRSMVNDFHEKQGRSNTAVLQQKINAYVSRRLDTESDWSLFLIKFEQKNGNFFRTMKIHFPDLTSSDLRLSACLKMNLSTKEIAALMNLSFRTVENGRYRLRKKLNLQSDQNLSEFLMHIDGLDAENDDI